MRKVMSILLCFVSAFSLCSCGCGNSADTEASVEEVTEATEEASVTPDMVPEESPVYSEVKSMVSKYLDTFISCDFDAIKSQLHEDDKWLFNFDSEDQLALYKAIFPLLKYEFEFVAEHDGVYGIMTRISSPDMADVYGTLITEYLDYSMENNRDALKDIAASNTERMVELITSPDVSLRSERLYIYVEYIDGEYIPRCDAFLANELTGGAVEASSEISSTLASSVNALIE